MVAGLYTEVDKETMSKDALLLPIVDSNSVRSSDENRQELIGKSAIKEKTAESGGKIIWRIANGLMTIFFVMAAGVQFNDPDPYLWAPLYGTAAALTVSVTIQPNYTGKKWWKSIYWVHATFCIGMFCYAFVELVIAATNPQSDGSLNPLTYEEGRELAGIMITVIWLFTCKQSPTINNRCKAEHELAIGILILLSTLLPLLCWVLCYSDGTSPSYFSFCGDYFMDEFSF